MSCLSDFPGRMIFIPFTFYKIMTINHVLINSMFTENVSLANGNPNSVAICIDVPGKTSHFRLDGAKLYLNNQQNIG
jgi:hypothetical protein